MPKSKVDYSYFNIKPIELYSRVGQHSLVSNIFFVLILLILSSTIGYSQDPYITNYSSNDYSASLVNWEISQDNEGYIYVGNSDGLLIYNGQKWNLIQVKGRVARAVQYSKKYGILVGTANDFGRIEKQPNGIYKYKSFDYLLPDSLESFKTIFNIVVYDDLVFLETQDYVLKFDGTALEVYSFPDYIVGLYKATNEVYAIGAESIYRYEKDEFVRITSTNFRDLGEINFITETENNELLISIENKLFVKLPNGLNGSYELWNKNNVDFLKNHKLYIITSDAKRHRYRFFPTFNTGLLILDQSGNPISNLKVSDGLISNEIQSIFVDVEKNAWVSTTKGISKINFEIPFKKYADESGLVTPILSVLEHNGNVYAGTNSGIFYLDKSKNKFIRINSEPSQFWDIIPFQDGVLAAGGNQGFYFIKDHKIISQQHTELSTMSIATSINNPNRIYVGLYNSFLIFDYDKAKKSFNIFRKMQEISADIRTILEDTNGNIWAGSKYAGLYKIKLAKDGTYKVKRYTANQGYFKSGDNQVYGSTRFPIFTSTEELYSYSVANDTFMVIKYPEVPPVSSYPNLRLDGNGQIWDLSSRFILNTSDANRSDSTSLNFFKSELVDLSNSSENSYWIATLGALYKIELPFNLPEPPGILKPISAKVSSNSVAIPIRFISENQYAIELPSNTPAFDITFSFPTFIQEDQVRFRYLIKGFKEHFTDWSKSNNLTIGGLPFGNFELKMEVLTGTGLIRKPVFISVKHPSPWYLQVSFILLISGVLITVVIGFIKLRNNQILKRNEYLEFIVRSRTDEMRSQNDKLKDLANEMAKTNQLKSKMLQMAVHDLRNPLSVLLGYCDILSDEDDVQQQQLVLRSIERVIEKMLNSIESLLSADEKGYIQPNSSKVNLDMRPLVLDVITDNSVIANQKKQTIDSELDSNCIILADRYQIIEVLENIVNNAIKYAPFNSQIIIRLQRKESNGNKIARFSVTDFGPGIKNEDRDRIFTPYARSENSPTAGEISTGLGLSIVKEIVQWHHGKIWVESDSKQHGSTFIVELPLSS